MYRGIQALFAAFVVALTPTVAFAQACACSHGSIARALVLALVAVLVSVALGTAGMVALATGVARGLLRRNAPWMRLGFRGLGVAFVSTALVTAGLGHLGLFREGHTVVGLVAMLVASAALQGVYLYAGVTGIRAPGLPGA